MKDSSANHSTKTIDAKQSDHIFTDADATVHSMRSAFELALRKRSLQMKESSFVLCGKLVRLISVGPQLHDRIRRPLAHLETSPPSNESISAELTIELWDEQETGVGCAGLEIHDELDAGKGDVMTVSKDARYVSMRRARSHAIYDRKDRNIIGWSCNGDRVSLIELGRPMQYLFYYWFHDANLQLIHSGMVGQDGAGILVAGRSGSGKSTTCLVCLDEGMNYLGDDVLAMSGSSVTGFIGHSVYNSNHLLPRDVDRFPKLKESVKSGGTVKEDKWVAMLHELYPGQFLSELPICAIALPKISDQPKSSFRPASKAQALMTIAPSSITLIEGAMPQGLARLGELVEHVPAYWIELGRDFRSTPTRLRKLIADLK